MSQNILRKSLMVGNRQMIFETGRLAKQAAGSVLVTYGETMVNATATASKEPKEGLDFFPLTCDYEERQYAAGKIPGGFIKREGRPSEKAVLNSRLMDRPIRPLFPDGYRNDVQVVAMVLSVDMENAPEMAAMNGASAALHISHIPFQEPIAAVTMGLIDGQLIVNPNREESEKTDLHLVVAGTKDAVMMVEAGANEVPEDKVLEAILTGHEEIKKIVDFIEEFRKEALELGLAKEKEEPKLALPTEELVAKVRDLSYDKLYEAVKKPEKMEREDAIKAVRDALFADLGEEHADDEKAVKEIYGSMTKEIVRKLITEEKIRPDGRATNEIRPITCEVGVLPRPHGSGLFTRGQTQVLSVVALGALGEEQIIDGIGTEESKRYIHHYNFPPFSVGEARPMRSPGRREIGHGALAERALLPMIPDPEVFPYTIRIVSDCFESNGSTSQASVCGSTLSLMDAGVPIKKPVAGIAMGLVKQGDKFAILTDIQGMEDALGDMDFKVAGTKDGITAIQMDIKVDGLSKEILEQALSQAHEGRLFILDKMLQAIPEPRKDLSPYAPRIITLKVHPDKVREIIGPGGKMIKKIIEASNVKIDIEDDGTIYIVSPDQNNSAIAVKMIEELTEEVEVGKTYMGTVKRLMNFGAFVEVLPGKEGLVHISQLAKERVNKVEDVVKEGDQLEVKVIEIDKQGRVNLSHKATLQD